MYTPCGLVGIKDGARCTHLEEAQQIQVVGSPSLLRVLPVEALMQDAATDL